MNILLFVDNLLPIGPTKDYTPVRENSNRGQSDRQAVQTKIDLRVKSLKQVYHIHYIDCDATY